MIFGWIIFFLFILFVASAIIILSTIYLKKYTNDYKKNGQINKIKFISLILGIMIGIFLILILVYFTIFYLAGFPTEITWTKYITENKTKKISNIIRIDQFINAQINTRETKYGFLKTFEKGYPAQYWIELNDISENILKIKFNSITLNLDDHTQEIISNDNLPNISISVLRENTVWFDLEEKIQVFIENREIEIEFEENEFDKLKAFSFRYKLQFDYELIEYFSIILNIDIELKNGDIINIEEMSKYKKEIIIEKINKVEPILKIKI